MMKLLSSCSLIASIVYIHVGISIYMLNKSSKECRAFLLLNMNLAIWCFAYAFAYTAGDVYSFSFWNKLSAIGWCSFPALILYLVMVIQNHKGLNNPLIKAAIFLPGTVFWMISVFVFKPDAAINKNISSFFYIGDFVYNTGYLFISIVLMYLWGRRSMDQNHKKQAIIIVVSSLVPFLLNLLTQTILPALGIGFIPNMGQLYALIMLWGVYYAIRYYGFFDIPSTLITKELFDEIIDLTFLIDAHGNILRINKQVTQLLKYEESTLAGTPITDLIKDRHLSDLIASCDFDAKPAKLDEVDVFTEEGDRIPLSLSLRPLVDTKRRRLLGILIIGEDIRLIKELQTEIMSHKVTAEKLKNSEEMFRTMVESMPYAIVLSGIEEHRVFYINSKAEEVFRIKKEAAIGLPVIDFYNDPEERKIITRDIAQGIPVKEREIAFKRKDQSVLSALLTIVPRINTEGPAILSCVTDITEQKQLQQEISKSEEMLKKVMNSIPDLVIMTDLKGGITFVNQSAKDILGYDQSGDSFPQNILALICEKDLARARTNLEKMQQSELGPVEYKQIKKDGSLIDVEVNGTILKDRAQVPFGMVFVIRDIHERKKYQESLKKSRDEIEKINNELLIKNNLLHEKSIRDSLTNLYNHQYINELLMTEIKQENLYSKGLCLMMLDIDFFKGINDTFGHQQGDRVIVTLSNILKSNIRKLDYAGRYGGEEFIIILPQIQYQEAYDIAEHIRQETQRFNYGKEGLHITISIGVAQYHSGSAEAFVNKADTLLYLAKKNGRNRTEIEEQSETAAS